MANSCPIGILHGIPSGRLGTVTFSLLSQDIDLKGAPGCRSSSFGHLADQANPLKIEALGLDLTVRLPLEASGGELTLFETVNAPGIGPLPHRHREAEIFRVLEGQYLFQVDDRLFEASAGHLVSFPGGAAHAFANISDRPARQLVVMLPGMDAHAFFLALSEVLLTKPEPR